MRTFRSLARRNYRLYFLGQLVSLPGSWMQSTALMWLAYDLTHQSKWPAFLAAAQLGPTLLFGTLGGALADRWPRKPLIAAAQLLFLLNALALTAAALTGAVSPWLLLVLATFNGFVQAVDLPTRLAFVPELVERDELINAVALNSLLFNAARAVGPAAAGVALYAIPDSHTAAGVCFLANALTYVAVLVALALIRTQPRPAATGPRSGPRAGFAVLAANPRLGGLVLLAFTFSVCGWPVLALLPALAAELTGVHGAGYSFLLSGVGCGALAAALTAATFSTEARRRAFLGLGSALTAAALAGLSAAGATAVAVACCAALGFGMVSFLATAQAAVQLGTPDAQRGRVMGVWASAIAGASPVGNLLAGPLADEWGVGPTLAAQSVGCAVVALAVFFTARRIPAQTAASGALTK